MSARKEDKPSFNANNLSTLYLVWIVSLFSLSNFCSDAIKEAGRVGLPCIVVDKGEKIYFGLPEDLDELR